jgi:hypothetical protein
MGPFALAGAQDVWMVVKVGHREGGFYLPCQGQTRRRTHGLPFGLPAVLGAIKRMASVWQAYGKRMAS